MRAWTYSASGKHRQILSNKDIPSPNPPKGDEVLIKVAYAGLNPGDTKAMRLIPTLLRPKNSIPGQDYSGTIISLGPSAPPNLVVGMRVFGMMDIGAIFRGDGTLAEYICLSASKCMVAPVPDDVSLEDASCVAAAGVMAFLSCKYGDVRPENGYRVLVTGASGGCGSLFVQVIMGMGAKEVIATCSAANSDLVKSLGATRTIDYRIHTPLHEHITKEFADRPFDFIFDTVGDQTLYTNSPKYLKEDGVFVNIGDYTHGTFRTMWYWFTNTWWPTWLGGTPRRFIMFAVVLDRQCEEDLARFMAEGKVRAVIDRSVAFEQVPDALDVVAAKRARGRFVVKVDAGS